jgi:hypothetical protein
MSANKISRAILPRTGVVSGNGSARVCGSCTGIGSGLTFDGNGINAVVAAGSGCATGTAAFANSSFDLLRCLGSIRKMVSFGTFLRQMPNTDFSRAAESASNLGL